ncbi:glycine--tRNA ligase subunit beta [uncultured Anaeromusa sp.]|uniref:glycine--tRNA ligase subunit beta n=1 Tax=uncultured Anaeromusa sp. TaxID=673273 RepID=UPI0029C997E2|nr:glycine--tRNA ligase subunit beta [uncultured Anaeromusa sp.]
MAKDLLFEIGTEEIPARFMKGILQQLTEYSSQRLQELRLEHGDIQVFGTPRRMAVLVRNLTEQQEDRESENKGPSVRIAFDTEGKPTKAGQGFARGQGVDVNALVERDGYVYAQIHEQGKATAELLPELLLELLHKLNFPKNMHWGDLDMRFVRPIRWLVALYGQEIVPLEVTGVVSGRVSRGHRFLGEKEITIAEAAAYEDSLRHNFVLADPEKRRSIIRQQLEETAREHNGVVAMDEELLEEVVHLVEYPTALCGRFEEEYLELPQEAVITPMKEHQRYFPVLDQAGKLLPLFITVRNGGKEHLDVVRHGNERVLRARLADARFFYMEDQKGTLEQRVERLKSIVFQDGLGTMHDKVLRVQAAALQLGKNLQADEAALKQVARTAYLAKADLVTGMVCEFTELQGIMGREYAKLNGEDDAVAEGIYEHYLPRFAGDELPQGMPGRLVSIADKLDNIVATFSRGLIPTGSQDPYALRRQAQGILSTLLAAPYGFSLRDMVQYALEQLNLTDAKVQEKLQQDVAEFFRLRLKNLLLEQNVRYDVVDAILEGDTDVLYESWLKAQALTAAEGDSLKKAVQALTRASNLVKHATRDEIKETSFVADEEKTLYAAYQKAAARIAASSQQRDYAQVLAELTTLADPIHAFFEAVMVMDPDEEVKTNRLALLKQIVSLASGIGDLGKVIVA